MKSVLILLGLYLFLSLACFFFRVGLVPRAGFEPANGPIES